MSGTLEREALLYRLVELGARTTYVSEICGGISTRRIRDAYTSHHGSQPPRGKVPNNAGWYAKDSKRNIQSSLLAARFKLMDLFSDSRGTQQSNPSLLTVEGAHRFCDAYEDWKSKLGEQAEIDFTRGMVLLTSHLRTGQLSLKKCGDCSGSHLVLVYGSAGCPHCQERKTLENTRRAANVVVGTEKHEEQQQHLLSVNG